jgi:hypothetical protein
MSVAQERPEIIKDEHLEYLDELRELGATNMFVADRYLVDEFALSDDDAYTILGYWMNTFKGVA